jgi:hypothetical protein
MTNARGLVKSTTKVSAETPDAERQIKTFIDKFEPAHQKLMRAVRQVLQRRFPTASELVYDNYNFFVIGYSPTERPSDTIVSMAAGSNGVSLCFMQGAQLPDPGKLLLGEGKQTRFIRLDSVEVLARPGVETLIGAALELAKPLPDSGSGKVIIRSISAKQRPRRSAGTSKKG